MHITNLAGRLAPALEGFRSVRVIANDSKLWHTGTTKALKALLDGRERHTGVSVAPLSLA